MRAAVMKKSLVPEASMDDFPALMFDDKFIEDSLKYLGKMHLIRSKWNHEIIVPDADAYDGLQLLYRDMEIRSFINKLMEKR